MNHSHYRKIISTDMIESLFDTTRTRNEKEAIQHLINIGFCQSKFYKPAVWNRSKKFMQLAVDLGLAKPYDFGRGKGKFISSFSIPDIVQEIYIQLY